MPDICLQFGQGGIQLGLKFFDYIYKSEKEEKGNWFYSTEKGDIARCILVDTESKVISDVLNEKRLWSYRRDYAIFQSGGSGNNWALGYSVHGPLLAESVLEKIRLECEQLDSIRSILTFSSAGGGTGSGVGTHIIEKLQDLFPSKYLISSMIMPSISGVSPVHLYNTVLSLSHIIDSTDALITFYNDYLFKLCSQLYKDNEFKFDDMNNIISKQLCTLFHTYNGKSFIPYYIQKLIPNPNYKLVSLKSFPNVKDFPQGNHSYEPFIPWKSVIDRLKSLIVDNSEKFWDNQTVTKTFSQAKQNNSCYYRSLGNLVMCRGKGSINAVNYASIAFDNSSLYSGLSQETDRFSYMYDNAPAFGQQQLSCLATNSSIFNNKLNSIIDESWNSFVKNAYIHHYQKYGLEERDFTSSFIKMENLIKKYQLL